MQVTFDHSVEETSDIVSLFFKTERPVDYVAGQFIQLSLPHEDEDDRGSKRWFTLSSSPSDKLISITTKFAGEKGSSYKKALRNLQPGTNVAMSDPMGDFVLPKQVQTPLIFVAAGMGITPFHSMMRWLAQTGESRPIKFLYAVHSEDDIIFQDVIAKANIHATIIVTEPSPAWGGERGHVTAEMVLGLELPTDDTLIYISGPEQMVESLQADLKKAGITHSQLIGDFFPGYPSV
jgi:ferredoxin-NADP reductase